MILTFVHSLRHGLRCRIMSHHCVYAQVATTDLQYLERINELEV